MFTRSKVIYGKMFTILSNISGSKCTVPPPPADPSSNLVMESWTGSVQIEKVRKQH